MTTQGTSRPRVFLEISEGTEPLGRLVIELFTDQTPKTCENFRALCVGSKPALTYKASSFHRIIDEFMIQGGDITRGDGTGGDSIYGGEFEDENLSWRDIDKEGLVCMANHGKATNSSQFFITLAPCDHLNGKHTVFGRIVSGHPVLEKMAKVEVNKDDRPLVNIMISRCGELERRKPAADNKPVVLADANRPEKRDDMHGRKKQPRSSRSRTPEDHSPAAERHHRSPQTNGSLGNGEERKRNDHAIDKSLRGRKRRTSDADDQQKKTHREERQRSPSPSREGKRHRPQSRSRSRSRSPGGFRRRRSLPNHYERRAEQSRYNRDEQYPPRYTTNRDYNDGDMLELERNHAMQGGQTQETVRLDSKREAESGEPEIKFKGRGAMKFRERKGY